MSWPFNDDTDDLQEPTSARELRFRSIGEVLAEVAAMGRREYLVEPLWPHPDYGVIGAEDKAGKTWVQLDLCVSVAAGVPFLGRFPCPSPGPVTVVLAEGGMPGMVRKLEAVSANKGIELADLPLRLEFKPPDLTRREHLDVLAKDLAEHPPRLLALDPLYLMAGGRSGSNLFEMGEVLSGPQAICQDHGTALAITHHWNKGGTGRGPERFSGVGPGAWGRVLASAAVEQSHVDPETRATTVTLAWTFRGGEIPDVEFRTRRRVWADNPNDVNSPLHYELEVTDEGAPGPELGSGFTAKPRLLRLLCRDGKLQTPAQLQDRTAQDGAGRPLKLQTVRNTLNALEKDGLVHGTEPVPGYDRRWSLTPNGERAIGGCPPE